MSRSVRTGGEGGVMGTLGIDRGATIHEVLTSDSTSKQPLILVTLFIKSFKSFCLCLHTTTRHLAKKKNRSFVVEVIIIITLSCKSVGDVPLHSLHVQAAKYLAPFGVHIRCRKTYCRPDYILVREDKGLLIPDNM